MKIKKKNPDMSILPLTKFNTDNIRRIDNKGTHVFHFLILPKTEKRYGVQVNIGCDLHMQQPCTTPVGHTEYDMAYLCSPRPLPFLKLQRITNFLEKYKRLLFMFLHIFE